MVAEEEQEDENGEKSGPECFRALLRVFPSARLEDYYKNGVWQTETILIDTELIEAHRKESGAPEPPPLEEVKLPDIRPAGARPFTLLGTLKPPAAFGATKPSGLLPSSAPSAGSASRYPLLARTPPPSGSLAGTSRLVQRIPPLKPPARLPTSSYGSTRLAEQRVPLRAPTRAREAAEESDNAEGPKRPPLIRPAVRPATSSGAPAPSSGPASELRQIALFISKWQLEPTKAKLVLARLPASRRRWVMTNYKGTTNLAAFIQHVSRTNAWANALSGASAASGTSTGAAPKRPLGSSEGSSNDSSKRPRTAAVAPTSSTSRGPPPAPAARGSVGARQAAKATEAPPPSGRPPSQPIRASSGNRIPPRIAPSTNVAGRARPSSPKPTGPLGPTSRQTTPQRVPSASTTGGGSRSSQPPKPPPMAPRAAGGSTVPEKPGSLIRSLLKLA